jgi:hypothetical protein
MSLLDFHAIVNVLNVLQCELIVLGMNVAQNDDHFNEGIAVVQTILGSLTDHDLALHNAARVDEFERVVLAEIERKVPADLTTSPILKDTHANIRAVFAILKVRAREILARASAPEEWLKMDVAELESNFAKVFAAMEKVSRGRFRIVYNRPRQNVTDYCVQFKVEVADSAPLYLPPVLHDVMRDLIANARKFTAPGGDISAALRENGEGFSFVVRDTGRGIPVEEIKRVVEFGKRASNTADVRGMGGGFGLTKAFLVTKQFGGRMWIASELGRGTEVRIVIPYPPGLVRRAGTEAEPAQAVAISH